MLTYGDHSNQVENYIFAADITGDCFASIFVAARAGVRCLKPLPAPRHSRPAPTSTSNHQPLPNSTRGREPDLPAQSIEDPCKLKHRTAMVANAKMHTSEDAMVERLHRAVGGPAALSGIDDPVAARTAVLTALASQQTDAVGVQRVLRGDLTPHERRTVRTVTNRGAAVRSRVRQRRELARLRDELMRKDAHVKRLESILRQLSASVGVQSPAAVCAPSTTTSHVALPALSQMPSVPPMMAMYQTLGDAASSTCSASSLAGDIFAPQESLCFDATPNRDLFCSFVDQLVEPTS
eukprot:IDg23935t1